MVGEAGRVMVGDARLFQSDEDPAMPLPAPDRRDRFQHGEPGELVSELECRALALQDSQFDALVEPFFGGARSQQNRRLRPPRNSRHAFEGLPSHRTQSFDPGEHGVSDGGRYQGTRLCENLADEERVASRDAVELDRIGCSALGEATDGFWCERFQPEAILRTRHDLGQCRPQRATRRHVIFTEGDDDQRLGVGDTPAQEGKEVQSRIVGPMDVLDDYYFVPAGLRQLVEHGFEDHTSVRSVQ